MIHRKKILLWILSLISILAFIIYLSIAFHYRTHFYSGSYINNINYSGKTVKEVEADIENEISKYQITIQGRNGVHDTIHAADIDYHYVSDGQVQALKDQQNPLFWPFSFFTKKHLDMQIACKYDEKSLLDSIANLLFFLDDVVKEPKNAEILYGENGYYIKPEDWGTTLDIHKVQSAITEAIKESKSTMSLEGTHCYIDPTTLSSDEAVQTALETLLKYTSSTITYDFGDRSEVLDRSILHDWVTLDENFNVTLNQQKAIDYVNYLGYYYTTFSSTRDFIRQDGKTIKVRGGDYGWIINRSKEAEELYQLIQNGESVTREPVYSQTAVSRNKNDIGSTYVEVNLKKQHLWLFVDGKQILDSNIVTGNISKDYGTPTGIYAITYKEHDATLVGQDYSSPVRYWMPFNKNIGFHDAPWRKEFGKKIYKTRGSHGCVNMPPKKAAKLYDNIQKGTPIVIY